jgi:hypothetical protein
MELQQMNLSDSSRNLLRHSKKLHNLLHSERDAFTDRRVMHELRMIGLLKVHLLKLSIRTDKWKSYGVQASLKLDESEASLITEMLRLKKGLLLRDVYDLVFKQNLPYQLVYQALYELMVELKMQNQLMECMRDPLTMVLYSMNEHSLSHETLHESERILAKVNGDTDFSTFEILSTNP